MAAVQLLVIEDSEEDVFFLRRRLDKLPTDFHLIAFDQVEAALEHLDAVGTGAYDVILVDINLPRANGFAFLDAIRCRLRAPVAVYVMSGSIDPQDELRALNYPVVKGYLKKPIRTQDLTRIFALSPA